MRSHPSSIRQLKKTIETMKRLLAGVIGSAILFSGGCSGPPPEESTASAAEGLWSGNTSANRTLTAAVLDDGTYYFFYSAVANSALLGGVIQGSGESDPASFTSSNAKDFVVGSGILDAALIANYEARRFLNGSLAYIEGGTVSFTTSYNPIYETTPALGSLAGVYQAQAGRAGGAEPATVTVAADGTYTGAEQNGCSFTGRVSPRSKGNIFDYRITFGGGPCFFAGSTLHGMWHVDMQTRRLYAAALTEDRTDAAILFGLKLF